MKIDEILQVELIKNELNHQGKTRKELAKYLGTCRSYIDQLLSGHRKITYKKLVGMCEFLGITEEDLKVSSIRELIHENKRLKSELSSLRNKIEIDNETVFN